MLSQQQLVLLVVVQLLLRCGKFRVNIVDDSLVANGETLNRRIFSLQPINLSFEQDHFRAGLLQLLLQLLHHAVVCGNCILVAVTGLLCGLSHVHQH